MGFVISVLIIICITVIPVMIAASLMGARNTGFFASLLAVILAVVSLQVSQALILNPAVAGLVAIAVTAVFFSIILEAKYVQSICIALLSFFVQWGIIFLLASLGFAATYVSFGFN